MPLPPQKILIIRPDALGDVVLSTPLATALKQIYPQASITFLVQPYTQAIVQNNPCIDLVILDWKATGKIKTFFDFLSYVQYIRSKKFDIVFLPYLEFFYANLAVWARIPVRVGDANKILLRPWLTTPVPIPIQNLIYHETELVVRLLKPFVSTLPSPQISVPSFSSYQSEVDHLLSNAGWQKKSLIAIHPTTGGSNRAWTPTSYAALIDLIHTKTPHQVVLTGFGNTDMAIANQIVAHCKTLPLSLVNQTTLEQLGCLISQCQAMIGTDTGPLHLAAGLHVPVLSLSPTKFTKPLRWGPWNTRNRIARNPQDCPLVCHPQLCQESHCLDAVTPHTVFQTLQDLLTGSQETLNDSKKRWFRASITVLVWIENSDFIAETQELTTRLKEEKISFYLGARSPSLCQSLMEQGLSPILMPKKWTYIKQFLSIHDVSFIQLATQKNKYFWTWVSKIAGLRLSTPPTPIFGYPKRGPDPLTLETIHR